MANKDTATLTAASTPLGGTELVHIVQGGNSRKVAVSDLRTPLATQAEAEAGSNNTAVMTPLRVKQAISKLSSAVVIETKDLAGVTFADFTAIRSSEFDSYWIELSDLVPATHGVNVYLRYMTGGTQIATGNLYRYGEFRFTGLATGNASNLSSNEFALVAGETLGNTAASMRVSGRIHCDIRGSTAKNMRASMEGFWSSSTHVADDAFAYLVSGASIDGFRIFLTTGAFTGGQAKLIGIRSIP